MRIFLVTGVCLALSACGAGAGGREGVYYADPGAMLNPIAQIELKPGGVLLVTGKTEVMGQPVTQNGGTTLQGTYAVNGNSITLVAGGDTQVFSIDGMGCLQGPPQVGKFCKR